MNNLMDVRRRDTFEVQQNLQALEIHQAHLELELVSLRNETEDRVTLIRRYEEMFGSLIPL